MRFVATCYRFHDPLWSFKPISGEGAAIHGRRFNPKGVPALYLSQTIEGAIREISQGFAKKIEPCVLCSYDVDCDDIVDLTTDVGRAQFKISASDLSCAWKSFIAAGIAPPSWTVARRLIGQGVAGIVVPSFAVGATVADQNLVLWDWGPDRPHQIQVYDPSGRLPRNQLSWD